MINTELYDAILLILHYMFLSDMREDGYHFICKKYSYAKLYPGPAQRVPTPLFEKKCMFL